MARKYKSRVTTEKLDAKIEQQKETLEKAKARYEAEKQKTYIFLIVYLTGRTPFFRKRLPLLFKQNISLFYLYAFYF